MTTEAQAPQSLERSYPRARWAVPAARAFARESLSCWQVNSERINEISLCCSELTTNAVVHGMPPGSEFRLVLLRHHERVRVEVHDSGGGVPVLRQPEHPEEESGRGLLLVAVLADLWGVDPRVPGKTIWCEFDLSTPGTGLLANP